MKHNIKIEAILSNLPDKPGVYKFLDSNGTVLYVGKAKSLKKRVKSYWTHFDKSSGKVKVLISKTQNIEYIVTRNETDAFLLENNLIKSLKPKYNVLLRDDKTYPWIKITADEYPRIIKTRQYTNDGSKYFGPYPSVNLLSTLLELLHKLFHLRTCKLNLTSETIQQKKFKVCLEFHIGNCNAPCTGFISRNEYLNNIVLAEKVLKGDLKAVNNYLNEMMHKYAKNLEFERAQEYKLKIDLLNQYQSRSVVVNPKLNDLDVFTAKEKNNKIFINYIKIYQGSVVQSHNLVLEPQIDEAFEDLFIFGILHIREQFKSNSKEIVVPYEIHNLIKDVKVSVPKSGDKYKLLQLSFSNLDVFAHQYNMNKLKANYGNVNIKLLEKVKSDLQLNELPVRIECFDISHHQGHETVGSCVVFINGKPSKADYRHFKIKTVEQINDFSSMYEIVHRRYKRLLEEQKPLPHLIIIDGGKGQLSFALKALNELNLNIDIISIAKRLEEIFKPGDSLPLYIDKRSETLKLIQRIRNEAHRFAISFHRNKSLTNSLTSILDTIPNIGKSTKDKLLEHFDSLDAIINANSSDLEPVIGKHKATIIYQFFHPEKSDYS